MGTHEYTRGGQRPDPDPQLFPLRLTRIHEYAYLRVFPRIILVNTREYAYSWTALDLQIPFSACNGSVHGFFVHNLDHEGQGIRCCDRRIVCSQVFMSKLRTLIDELNRF